MIYSIWRILELLQGDKCLVVVWKYNEESKQQVAGFFITAYEPAHDSDCKQGTKAATDQLILSSIICPQDKSIFKKATERLTNCSGSFRRHEMLNREP